MAQPKICVNTTFTQHHKVEMTDDEMQEVLRLWLQRKYGMVVGNDIAIAISVYETKQYDRNGNDSWHDGWLVQWTIEERSEKEIPG